MEVRGREGKLCKHRSIVYRVTSGTLLDMAMPNTAMTKAVRRNRRRVYKKGCAGTLPEVDATVRKRSIYRTSERPSSVCFRHTNRQRQIQIMSLTRPFKHYIWSVAPHRICHHRQQHRRKLPTNLSRRSPFPAQIGWSLHSFGLFVTSITVETRNATN